MIVLALLAALQGAPSDTMPLGALGRQALPAKGCAVFLWAPVADRPMVAMASADPAMIRLSIDGKVVDLARRSEQGAGGYGFAAITDYASATLTVTLDMTIAPRADLSNGAMVPRATLRLDRQGQDTVIVPVAGLIGCS